MSKWYLKARGGRAGNGESPSEGNCGHYWSGGTRFNALFYHHHQYQKHHHHYCIDLVDHHHHHHQHRQTIITTMIDEYHLHSLCITSTISTRQLFTHGLSILQLGKFEKRKKLVPEYDISETSKICWLLLIDRGRGWMACASKDAFCFIERRERLIKQNA